MKIGHFIKKANKIIENNKVNRTSRWLSQSSII